MTHTIKIFGASDDLIEVEGQAPGCDEYNAEIASFIVTGAEASTRVTVFFNRHGCWAITVAPLDEDVPMLPVSIVGDRYTARATFERVSHITLEASGV